MNFLYRSSHFIRIHIHSCLFLFSNGLKEKKKTRAVCPSTQLSRAWVSAPPRLAVGALELIFVWVGTPRRTTDSSFRFADGSSAPTSTLGLKDLGVVSVRTYPVVW